MPKPHRRQATWAPRVSTVFHWSLSHGLPRLGRSDASEQVGYQQAIVRAWRCLGNPCRRVAQALDHEWDKRRHWHGRRRTAPGVCHAKAASPPSNVGTPSEHPPIACSPMGFPTRSLTHTHPLLLTLDPAPDSGWALPQTPLGVSAADPSPDAHPCRR